MSLTLLFFIYMYVWAYDAFWYLWTYMTEDRYGCQYEVIVHRLPMALCSHYPETLQCHTNTLFLINLGKVFLQTG